VEIGVSKNRAASTGALPQGFTDAALGQLVLSDEAFGVDAQNPRNKIQDDATVAVVQF
jgi:hypothetical protein